MSNFGKKRPCSFHHKALEIIYTFQYLKGLVQKYF